MKISTWAYSLKQGIINIKRNKLFSLASIATIAICIFLIGLFYSVFTNINNMITQAEEQISVTVFFKQGITDDEINSLKDKISQRAEVKEVVYTSSEEAWEQFKEIYFKDHMDLAEGFKDDNPLANSASFEIFLNDISMQDVLVSYLNSLSEEGIRQVNSSENTASTVSEFGKLVGYVSVALIVILLAVAVFLISNTITMGITVRKEEIGIMKLMGAEVLFLTNASGGVNHEFSAGDFMLIQDQIADFVPSPLIGANIEELGPRFCDMSEVYDKKLREIIKDTAKELGIPLKEGVYIQLTGPNFETPAEVRMCRILGADAVGMSTACEGIAANHMGMKICGISCISNLACGMTEEPLSHEEVQATADRVAPLFKKLITASIVNIAESL